MSIFSQEFVSNNRKIKVHCIQTGQLAIKKSAYHCNNPGLIGTLKSFWDKEFCEWLPVFCWLIEHPEGLFLIDTGMIPELKDKTYYRNIDALSRYYFTKQMRFKISEKDNIKNQLNTIGVSTESITKIILTHLHTDHSSGLKYFPSVEIIVNQKEWDTMDSSFPKLFPKNKSFNKVKLTSKFENFNNAYYLTKSKDLIMVETPGHTRGHCSVILKLDNNQTIFFGGDVAYNSYRLKNKKFSSTIKSHKDNIKSCNNIIDFAENTNTIFLSSHDAQNNKILNERLKLEVQI